MSCQTANNNATPPGPAIAPGVETIDVRAAAAAIGVRGMDPRVTALVPGFDAPFFQAGLSGYSDAAMRIIARRHGCPFCVTEALLDRTLLAGGRGFAKADLGELHDNVPGGEEDHPLAGQIMGSDPREMAASALKMAEQGQRGEKAYRKLAYAVDGQHPTTHARERVHLRLPGGEQIGAVDPWDESCEELVDETNGLAAENNGHVVTETGTSAAPLPLDEPAGRFEVIDVNLACPVKKIKAKARGGHWLAEPVGAIALLEAVREAVPAGIVCAVKMRRSFDDTPEMVANFERIFEAAYRIGYSWVTVHARTVEQKYVGPSAWTVLRDLAACHPDKVIFGSGDVWGVTEIFRMLAYTGVSAVSVARGCIGNPWIFRQAREMMAGREPTAPTIAQQRAVLEDHFKLAMKVNAGMREGEAHTGKTMRKFGIRFAAHHPQGEEVRQRMIAVASLEDWERVLDQYYQARD